MRLFQAGNIQRWATCRYHWQLACRDNKAKLMGRQWIIQDDKGKVVDQITGPGRQLVQVHAGMNGTWLLP